MLSRILEPLRTAFNRHIGNNGLRTLNRDKGRRLSSNSLLITKQQSNKMNDCFKLAKWPRKAWIRLAILGFGLSGIAYWGHGHVKDDRFKSSCLALLTTGFGYLGYRYIKVAHCQQPEEKLDKFDQILKEIHMKKEAIDEEINEAINKKVDELWAQFREKYVTEALEEAFDLLKEIMDNFLEYSQVDSVDFNSNLFILFALVKRAQDQILEDWLNTLPKKNQVDSIEEFEFHSRMAEHALNVYDSSWESTVEKQAEKLKIDPSDLWFTAFEDKEDGSHVPKYAIFLDRQTSNIVLAVRGTHCLTDVVIDAICDDDEFLDGFSHRGITRSAKFVLEECRDKLNEVVHQFPEFGLMITGHSLGAGTAELIAMQLLSGSDRDVVNPEETVIKCVVFAPPPIYRSEKALPASITNAIDIYINSQDCVPRMSLASIAQLVALIRAVDGLELTPFQQLQLLIPKIDELDADVKANLFNLKLAVAKAKNNHQTRFPFLEHPGQIHFMYRPPREAESKRLLSKVIQVKQKSQAFSRDLILNERMVLDHLDGYYRDALKIVAEKLNDLSDCSSDSD